MRAGRMRVPSVRMGVAPTAVNQNHHTKAYQHGEKLDQPRASLVVLWAKELEEDDIEDGAGGQTLQHARGQQTAALVRLTHDDTEQHTERRGQ